MQHHKNLRSVFFFIFALSGVSGLIYESVWSQYLKLFLGHAAYAQTLVLAIFMGGMAVGSWVCSRYSVKWRQLLLGYAVIEGIIGVLGLIFHNTFVGMTNIVYGSVLPNIGTYWIAIIGKWSIASLMILPQSVLLGMTFPLMTAGIIRRYPDRPGASISMLYFTNSIGGVVGVLVSGFVLLKLVGLPGTIMSASILNIFIALVVWALVRRTSSHPIAAVADTQQQGDVSTDKGLYFRLLIVALITGLASFIYEIGWIRMLSLVLGSSTHAFELMLSAFILGLALGGLWIRRRIDRYANPVRALGLIQIIMGVMALSTLWLYGNTFELMQIIMGALGRTDAGYALFNISSNGIAMLIMLPTTVFAGMTLPLITYTLIKRGHGEKSIGAVYAANTIGAIAGVFIAVHIGMPLLGLKGLIMLGALLDVSIGIWLLWMVLQSSRPRLVLIGAPALIVFLFLPLFWLKFDPLKLASGVYRSGRILNKSKAEVIFHRDGKTATVNLIKYSNGEVAITTNGKPDATINMGTSGKPSLDETTMTLIGVLPHAYRPDARDIANIGFGSGLTTHTLLQADWVRRMDTIEIEPAMIAAAKGYGKRVEAAYKDPRSRLYIDDAKTFFSINNRQYDIIVSEPSNPWVSGVASLFTDEFYRLIKRYLKKDGLFVQWIQLYENEPRLVASVMKALSKNFSDYVVYATDNGNLVFLAKGDGRIGDFDHRITRVPEIRILLGRIGISNYQDIHLRYLGSKKVLDPLFQAFPIAMNSDYFPILDLHSTRARFLNSSANTIADLAFVPLPINEMLGGFRPTWKVTAVNDSRALRNARGTAGAMAVRDYLLLGNYGKYRNLVTIENKVNLELFKYYLRSCKFVDEPDLFMKALLDIANTTLPYLTAHESKQIWSAISRSRCAGRFSREQRQWIALFLAISDRNGSRMQSLASSMLKRDKARPLGPSRYLLDAALLGALSQGKPETAKSLWGRYGGRYYRGRQPPMLTRLLIAHSLQRSR